MATKPKTRKQLIKGVYEDRSGILIRVHVHGKPRDFRADEHGRRYKHYRRSELRNERTRIQARERLKEKHVPGQEGTLRADVRSYTAMLTGRSKDDARTLLEHWTKQFGDRERHTLTAVELRQYAATWLHKGKPLAASTFNHRRQALSSLYRALDGPGGYNPVREIPKHKEIMGAPKALSYDVIRAVFEQMPDTQSRARLKLMAYTGLPQMQIEKLTRQDWQGDRLRVTPRRKGTGAAGRWLPLSPDAQAALKDFARLKCWGSFSRSSLCKAWKAFGPPGTNPYSLRHSWITELYRRSNGDVIALQQLALHSRLEQTQRYAAAALQDRMNALVLPRSVATMAPADQPNSLQFPPQKRRKQKGGTRGRKSSKTTKKR